MSFEATTTTAALPTPNTEVAFGSLANQHNYFDAYVDFLANTGNQKVQLRIYATSAASGVRALVAQSDWLVAQLGAVPVRAIAGLKYEAGTLFELQVIADAVCGNVKASLVGYEAQENFIPQDSSTATTAIAATETVMATITRPHSFFKASADTLAALNCRVRWSLYATAGAGGVRAKVAQFDMPPSTSANQKAIVLDSIGPIGADTIELTSQALDAVPASPNVKASLDGFDPIVSNVATGGANPDQTVYTFLAKTVGQAINQSLVAYDVSAANNDNVALVEGDIVLLVAQTSLIENGPWRVGAVAAGVAPLTRPSWFANGLRIAQANYYIDIQGSGNVWAYNTFVIIAAAGGAVVGTNVLFPAARIMRGTATLVAGTVTVTLPRPKLANAVKMVSNTTSGAPLQSVFTGAGATLTVTDPLGGADTFDWLVVNF